MSKLATVLFSSTIIIALAAWENGVASNNFLQLQEGWKFKIGDNLDFAKPDFDDSDWKNIRVDETVEQQGFEDYDGFSWYRIRFFLSSSLKKNAALTDSIIFNLGKIDDFNQVFFNGEFIGENIGNVKRGRKPTNNFKDKDYTFWNVNRRYSLPIDDNLIKWDAENVIAIRVYDWGGAGGIFSGNLKLKMPEITEYLSISVEEEFESGNEYLKKSVTLENTSDAYQLGGTFEIFTQNNISEETHIIVEKTLKLQPNEKRKFSFSFPKPKQSTELFYEFKFDFDGKILKKSEGIPYILTPPTKPEPQINGALIYGERAGKPFLFRIAATGKTPLKFSAQNLPAGLSLDEKTGIIRGIVRQKGDYQVEVFATNELGSDRKNLEIVIGNKLALTPPMGWNSWNCWGLTVSEEKIYAAAKAFVDLDLANHGWTFINIDDGWEVKGNSEKPKRTSNEAILTNGKFPNMKKLGDDIHALGLKFGIYSSPGPLTCGGFTGSYKHEFQDAKTFAAWGIDYLKYDLCGLRDIMKDQYSSAELIPPYELMHEALEKIDRDIIYSICEYGNGKVWEWGEKVGGNLWRTTGDIWDDWDRMYQIGFGQLEAAKYGGPGHWNDPDMLIIGWLGWGENLHKSKLTPDEQYTHVSLWALLSAPLLLGNDLSRLDEFTLNLITNDEVIAIDQDKLGKQAVPIIKENGIEVWKKELSNGNLAFGIFNVNDANSEYSLDLKKLGLKESVILRDVWRQKNLGKFSGKFTTKIPSHGVILLQTKIAD